jgi:hypothetical protein
VPESRRAEILETLRRICDDACCPGHEEGKGR